MPHRLTRGCAELLGVSIRTGPGFVLRVVPAVVLAIGLIGRVASGAIAGGLVVGGLDGLLGPRATGVGRQRGSIAAASGGLGRAFDNALHALHDLLRHLRHGLGQALERLGDRLRHLPGHLAELAHHLARTAGSRARGFGTAARGRRGASSTERIGLGLEPLSGIHITACVCLRGLAEQLGHLARGDLGRTQCAVTGGRGTVERVLHRKADGAVAGREVRRAGERILEAAHLSPLTPSTMPCKAGEGAYVGDELVHRAPGDRAVQLRILLSARVRAERQVGYPAA